MNDCAWIGSTASFAGGHQRKAWWSYSASRRRVLAERHLVQARRACAGRRRRTARAGRPARCPSSLASWPTPEQQVVAQRVEVGRVAEDLELAEHLRLARVGEVDRVERVDLAERHDEAGVVDEAHRVDPLALAEPRHLPQLEQRAGRCGRAWSRSSGSRRCGVAAPPGRRLGARHAQHARGARTSRTGSAGSRAPGRSPGSCVSPGSEASNWWIAVNVSGRLLLGRGRLAASSAGWPRRGCRGDA